MLITLNFRLVNLNVPTLHFPKGSDILSSIKEYILLITSIYSILSSIKLAYVLNDYFFSLPS